MVVVHAITGTMISDASTRSPKPYVQSPPLDPLKEPYKDPQLQVELRGNEGFRVQVSRFEVQGLLPMSLQVHH